MRRGHRLETGAGGVCGTPPITAAKGATVAASDNPLLLNWLMLLGWQVESEHRDGVWTGVARHISGDGTELKVGGCAGTQRELVWQLFSGAVDALDDSGISRRLVAA
jgi:hypothetical protein